MNRSDFLKRASSSGTGIYRLKMVSIAHHFYFKQIEKQIEKQTLNRV
jgi:hypothetical protein